MKKLTALLIAVLLLVQPASAFAEDDMEQYRSGTPWLCLALDGVVTEDTPVDLKDNFALAVSHDFYLNAELSEEYGLAGTVIDGNIATSEDIAALFADGVTVASEDAKLVKKLYDLQMNWDARNAQGVAPLKDLLSLLDGVGTVDEMNAYFLNTPVKDLLGSLYNSAAMFDLMDSSVVVGVAEPAALFLDSAEYGEYPTELGNMKRETYTALILGMLARLGYSEEAAQKMAEDAFAFESMLAPTILTADEERQADYFERVLNYFTRDEALELEGKVPMVEFAEKYYGTQDVWIVTMPAYCERLREIYTDENIGMIRNWLICHAVVACASLLDRDCYDFYNDTVSAMRGTETQPDEIIAAKNTASLLKWETAHLYCDTYVTAEDKAAVQAITDKVIATYKEILAEETFISEETRAAAISKLDNMIVLCMYPDDWSEYSYQDLSFRSAEEGGSLMEAVNAISEAALLRDVEELTRPKDRGRWIEAPTVFNCSNNPSANTINIFAAFCRGKIYNPDMSYEEMLGAIGMVIAHEITHSFDRMGAQFDENGEYYFWWTDEDYDSFMEKDSRMAAFYDSMTAWEGMPFNGAIMTGETCADMGGVKCMLRMASEIEDFDYDAFFRAYATLWAEKGNMYSVLSYLQDEHPVSFIRVNSVLQQFDEFLDFYGITEGDGMYLAPEDRVLIW